MYSVHAHALALAHAAQVHTFTREEMKRSSHVHPYKTCANTHAYRW